MELRKTFSLLLEIALNKFDLALPGFPGFFSPGTRARKKPGYANPSSTKLGVVLAKAICFRIMFFEIGGLPNLCDFVSFY